MLFEHEKGLQSYKAQSHSKRSFHKKESSLLKKKLLLIIYSPPVIQDLFFFSRKEIKVFDENISGFFSI